MRGYKTPLHDNALLLSLKNTSNSTTSNVKNLQIPLPLNWRLVQ